MFGQMQTVSNAKVIVHCIPVFTKLFLILSMNCVMPSDQMHFTRAWMKFFISVQIDARDARERIRLNYLPEK